MSEPRIACVLLTADRVELTTRAIQCFERQTYQNRSLIVLDNGEHPYLGLSAFRDLGSVRYERANFASIGKLRNAANALSEAEILVHWDSDDWSHANRITEQVRLLQSSGAEVVGYNEMMFWRRPVLNTIGAPGGYPFALANPPGEAWLYSNPVSGTLGTSLCYRRETWARHPFADETQGVEDHWLREKNVQSISAVPVLFAPRMIARIHGGNTSNAYRLEEHIGDGSKQFPREVQWKRVSQWDECIREILG